jgi:3-hydroxyisobutyrate dehydrogenase
MAANIARAGHEVVVWNRTREKAEAVTGADVVDTPAEAVRDAEVVLTILADAAAVEDVVLGIDELPVWIQATTVGLDATDKLAALAAQRGAIFVDAPVVGTKQPAEKGELLVLASGPEDAKRVCTPIFDAIGSQTLWLGAAGTGQRLKLVLNTWLVGILDALAESIALAQALGLDPQLFLDTIRGGGTDVPYAHLKGKLMIGEAFPAAFSARLARKDANLALRAAQDAGLELPGLAAAADQLARAVDLGHGDEDMAAVYLALRS